MITSTTDIKTIRFIVNPHAGIGNRDSFPQLVKNAINSKDFDYQIAYTTCQGHATELSLAAVRDNIDLVVAVGGDGTINEVARSLIDTETILGLIPAGSGNGLARHLNIPLHAEAALKLINQGTISKIDTGIVNLQPFVSIAGMGFDALVAKEFAKQPHRGFLSYFRIVATRYQAYKPKHYRIVIDGEQVIEKDALFVIMANSNQFGYNTTIAPNAKLNDGLIDVCIVEKPPIFEMPLIINLLFLKMIHHSKYINIHKARHVEVFRDKNRNINLDGEPVKLSKNLDITINPLSLNIIIP
jgi:diacylglycerol kinase (ATP)